MKKKNKCTTKFFPSNGNFKIHTARGEKRHHSCLPSSACKEKVSHSPEFQGAQVRLWYGNSWCARCAVMGGWGSQWNTAPPVPDCNLRVPSGVHIATEAFMVKWGLVRWSGPHLLHVLIEKVEDAVLVLGVPPALHVVVPGAPAHCRMGPETGQWVTETQWQVHCPSPPLPQEEDTEGREEVTLTIPSW